MKGIRVFVLATAVLLPAYVFAQQAVTQDQRSIHPDTYGTASLTWLPLSGWDFRPLYSAVTYDYANGTRYGIYATAGNYFVAPLRLPEGATVSTLDMTACDFNPSAELQTYITIAPTNAGSATNTPFLVTGGPAAPGCANFTGTFTPFTVDNTNYSYSVTADFTTQGSSLVLHSVRVGYKLQVSPPPGTATFTDVPTTHLFYQYVEALAASGITSGCGGGNFCPDAAVTRGQLAVFLSKALGLHWAP
jgi:S-layer family protein